MQANTIKVFTASPISKLKIWILLLASLEIKQKKIIHIKLELDNTNRN